MERKVGNTRQGDRVLKKRGRAGKTMREDDVKINSFPRDTTHIHAQKKKFTDKLQAIPRFCRASSQSIHEPAETVP